MLKKLGLYYRTIKHLRPIQIRYRLWYMLRDKFRQLTGHSYPLSIHQKGHSLSLQAGISKISTFDIPSCAKASEDGPPSTFEACFTFLNQSHTFKEGINWNFTEYGKLWAYNLNDFDYLHQEDINKEQGLELIRAFIRKIEDNREGLEPYPISLRGMNWIKFISKYDISDQTIDASLYAQYQILIDNLEYHLLGNHLLENGCSLLFGSYYFGDDQLYEKAHDILYKELDEQILNDGGHFERSTMYHLIMLDRLMDCYNLMINNQSVLQVPALEKKLKSKIQKMLSWVDQLSVLSFSGSNKRELPLLNDGAYGIAPTVEEVIDYADRLNIEKVDLPLSDSGYRRYTTGPLDLICDVGAIGPDYQPGHAHSDTFSFVLYRNGESVIIDPGISTYENNEQRQLERSTAFHNTVQYEDKEQSEVWSAFRVGRRARVDVKADDAKKLVAIHDGYQPWGITHERTWLMEEDHICIKDRLIGKENASGKFYLHFHPSLLGEVSVDSNRVKAGAINIEFESVDEIKKYSYDCPDGYNQYIKAPKIEVHFVGELESRILLNIEDEML